MLLQAFEGLSDREACDRLGFDLRWQAAAGVTIGAEAVPSDGARRAAQPPAGLGASPPAVRGHQGRRQGDRGARTTGPGARLDADLRRRRHRGHRHPAAGRDPKAPRAPSTRPTSPLAGEVRSGASSATTTTRHRASRRVTGTTERHERPSSTRSSATAIAALGGARRPRARRRAVEDRGRAASPSSPARTSQQGDDGIFRIVRGRRQGPGDLDGRHRGPPRPQVQATATSTATRPTSRSTRTPSSSPRSSPPRPTPTTATPCPSSLGHGEPRRRQAVVLGDSAYADGADARRPRRGGLQPRWRSAPRCATRPGASPRTASSSTSRQMTVTCPAGQSRSRHRRPPSGGGRASFKAHCGTCPLRALLHDVTHAGARSRSTARGDSPTARAEQADPPGSPPTGRTGRSSSARSRTSSGGPGEDDKARHEGCERIATDLDTRAGASTGHASRSSDLHLVQRLGDRLRAPPRVSFGPTSTTRGHFHGLVSKISTTATRTCANDAGSAMIRS